MIPELRPLDISQVSEIHATYSGALFRSHGCCEIVVVTCWGRYREGSAGKPDARMIHALGQAAVIAWEPLGIVLDFSELEYAWGDNFRDILQIGERQLGNEGLPLAIVVGPRCAEAVRSVFSCCGRGSVPEWIFDEFGIALDYIQAEIADLRVRYGTILPPISTETRGVQG